MLYFKRTTVNHKRLEKKKTLFKRDLVVALAYAHMQQKTFPLEKPS